MFHVLVAGIGRGKRTLRGDWHGDVLRVSPESKDRALRLLDALLNALGARGYTIELDVPRPTARNRYKLKVLQGPETVHLMLSERRQQAAHLRLQLHALFGALPRKSWSDGERRPLDDTLGNVVVAIDRAFAAIR